MLALVKYCCASCDQALNFCLGGIGVKCFCEASASSCVKLEQGALLAGSAKFRVWINDVSCSGVGGR